MAFIKAILLDLTAKFLLASAMFTLLMLFFQQPPIIPRHDISKCPPLTDNPKRLWAFWRNGADSMSTFNAETFRMWKHLAPDWEIRLLHYGNPKHECYVHNFIQPKHLPRTFENLTAPLSSDAVRIALMRLYGGVYMDVSIILLEPLEDIFWDRIILPEGDPKKIVLGGFYIHDMCFPGKKNGYELWMEGALPNEPIVVAWHDKFLKILEPAAIPFMRDEVTRKLNEHIEGCQTDHLGKKQVNYLCASTILQCTLQLDQQLNERFDKYTELYDVQETAFRKLMSLGFNSENFYIHLSAPSYQSSWRLRAIMTDTPVIKFIAHAEVFWNNIYSEWTNPHNVLSKIRRTIVNRAIELAQKRSRVHQYHYDHIVYVPS